MTKQRFVILGALFLCLAIGGLGTMAMLQYNRARRAGEFSQRVLRADHIEYLRCSDEQYQKRILETSKIPAVKRVLAAAIDPARHTRCTRKGCVFGFLFLEGPGCKVNVGILSNPLWLEVEGEYYTLTTEELYILRDALADNRAESLTSKAS